MRILLTILLVLTTKVYAEDFTGLFGIKFNENYAGVSIFEEKIVQEINSIEKLENLKKYYYPFGPKTKVVPIKKNNNFENYYVKVTPITGRVYSIGGQGDPLTTEKECNDRIEFYNLTFKEKYSSAYDIQITKGKDYIILNFFKFDDDSIKIIKSYVEFARISYSCKLGEISATFLELEPTIEQLVLNKSFEVGEVLEIIQKRIDELTLENSDADSSGL
ncbi:hypothetical protein OAN10_03340 [Alphaproteobacteria bacterium]|nr:hypothetical protein [Alphaproteobacteria bacterium]